MNLHQRKVNVEKEVVQGGKVSLKNIGAVVENLVVEDTLPMSV